MGAEGRKADDIGWGLLPHRGEVSQSYLWRSGHVRGYSITIVTARNVAEPAELTCDEAAAFWHDALALGRALEAHHQPLKVNYLLLGNAIAHAHQHVVPRSKADSDPAPGGPLTFDVLDFGRQDKDRLRAHARAVRRLLSIAGRPEAGR